MVLSWTHHLNKYYRDGHSDLVDYVAPWPNHAYWATTRSDQIGWQIAHFLPAVVLWIKAWVDYADSHRDRVLVTSYETMFKGQREFVLSLADFFELSIPTTFDPDKYRSEKNHFRKGKIDEWKEAFSESQMRQAEAAIPNSLMHRFGWAAT